MGSRDGAVVRALTSHQCGPGSIPAWCHVWVKIVVGSRLAPRFLKGYSGFLPPQKLTSPNSKLFMPFFNLISLELTFS